MTRLLVVEPGYCPYQAGFPSAMAAASEVVEGESQILKPFGTPRIGLICSKAQSRLKYNRQVNDEGITVRGRFLICGLNGDKVVGLSKDQADRYSRLLFLPQVEDINNLSDFVFSAIKAIGAILLGFGIVQIGLALKGHDASQRAQGFMTFFGGVVIYFAKDILDMIL